MKIEMLMKKVCFAVLGVGSSFVIAACYGAHMCLEGRTPPVSERQPQPMYGEQYDSGEGAAMHVAGGEDGEGVLEIAVDRYFEEGADFEGDENSI